MDGLDDLLIDLEDDDFDDDKTLPSLPLEKPKSVLAEFTSAPYDFKGDVEVTKRADKLFDFTESTLTPVQKMYIIGYATRGTRKGGCELAGISYGIVTMWLDNPEFVSALNSSVELVSDSLEEELLRRAMNGSDRLLLEAVKASKSDKYNRKQTDVNINGNVVHTWADLAKQAATSPEAKKSDYDID